MAHWTVIKVIRAWVDHNQRKTKTQTAMSGNIHFVGRTIHSFDKLLACYHRGPRGEPYVLIDRHDRQRGSMWRRATHASIVAQAVDVQKFLVGNVNFEDNPIAHEHNLLQMYADLRQKEDEGIAAFKRNMGALSLTWKSVIETHHEQIVRYVYYSGAKSHPPALDQIIEGMRLECARRWADWMDPKKVARRDRSEARKLAKKLLLGG